MLVIGVIVLVLVDVVIGLGFMGVLLLGGVEVMLGECMVGDFMLFFIVMVLVF